MSFTVSRDVFKSTGEHVVLPGNKRLAVGSLDLQGCKEITDNEQLKKVIRVVSKQYVLSAVSVIGLPVSAQGLFGKWEKGYVTRLDLSRSQASKQIFLQLDQFPALETIVCDSCPNLQLKNLGQHEKLRCISIIGSAVHPSAIPLMTKRFPSLVTIDYTVDLHDQVPIGLMHRHGLIHPVVSLPYGHVSAYVPANRNYIPLHTLTVRVQKVEKTWQVFILDGSRMPITGDGHVFLHKNCNQFFQNQLEDCPCCKQNAPADSYQSVELQLDSSLDFTRDFDMLPASCPYDLIRRSQFNQ